MKIQSTFAGLMGLLAISSATLISCGGNETKDATTTTGADTASTHTMTSSAPMATSAEATLSGTKADTTVNGTLAFTSEPGGKVKLTLQIAVPKKANQSVAVHLHEHGECGDTGTHAGGHWNPTATTHGQWGKGSFHSGDIGNIKLDAKGNGTLTVESDLWSLGGDAKTNIIGKSVIVHSGVDDYKSQPAGNSGSRIGCGVISTQDAQNASSVPSEPH